MSALKDQVGGNHYKNLAIQPIEYCQKNRLGYCESNAIKYITRHKAKNGKEDILKAIHVLKLLLELEYTEPLKTVETNVVPDPLNSTTWRLPEDLKGKGL
jgi:hypothetical protein